MGTITLPNVRVSSDLTVNVRLKDGGVAIDWSTLVYIKAWLYSDAQRALAGRCDVSTDAGDNTILVCSYAATKPQYLGVNRIIVQAQYRGRVKTYDKPALTFVPRTADVAGEQVVLDDPIVDVEIEVQDVTSSVLDAAVNAAIKAADEVDQALITHRGPQGESAYEIAVDNGFDGTVEDWLASLDGKEGDSAYDVAVKNGYVGTEEQWIASLKGEQGNTGSSVDYPFELVNNRTTNDPEKGLSAAEGYRIGNDLAENAEKVSILTDVVTSKKVVDIDSLTALNFYITNEGKWSTNSAYKHSELPVTPGQVIRVTSNGTNETYVSFLKSGTRESGGTPDFCASYASIYRVRIPESGTSQATEEFIVPDDATLFYFYRGRSADSYPYQPSSIIVISPSVLKQDSEVFETLSETVDALVTDTEGLDARTDALENDCYNENGENDVTEDLTWTDNTQILAVTSGSPAEVGRQKATEGPRASCDYVDVSGYDKVRVTLFYPTSSTSTGGLAFYDAQKHGLVGKYARNAEEDGYIIMEYDVPENAKYLRTTKWMDSAGVTEEFSLVLIKETLVGRVAALERTAAGGSAEIGSPQFYVSSSTDDGTDVNEATDSDVYALYDALVTAHPNFFFRRDDLGADSSGENQLRHYTLRMANPYVSAQQDPSDASTNEWNDETMGVRTIIITAGIHGNEKSSVYGVYLSLQAILTSSEPWAVYIRSNFILEIIPIVNVWGFNNNSRNNYNDVNINRDFYSATPQAETAIVKGLIASAKHLVAILDSHNSAYDSGLGSVPFGYFTPRKDFKYYEFYCTTAARIAAGAYARNAALWNKPSKAPYIITSPSSKSGTLAQYTNKTVGVLGGSLEAPFSESGGSINAKKWCEVTMLLLINCIQYYGSR